jgi:hypothetical protein
MRKLALATTIALLASSQAKATWYVATMNCLSIEAFIAVVGGPANDIHTPEDVARWWTRGGIRTIDITSRYSFLDPNIARVLQGFPERLVHTFGPSGLAHIFGSTPGACRELEAWVKNDELARSHQSPFRN